MWESDADAMRAALAVHDRLLRSVVQAHGGTVFKHTGDGVCAAFDSPRDAIEAAVAAQRQLELPVRMGVASGEVQQRDDDYFGPALNRAARVMGAGHGGQIVVSDSTAALVTGVDLLDLGEHRLRDLAASVRLYQVRADGLETTFPAVADAGRHTGEPAGAGHELRRPRGGGEGGRRARQGPPARDAHRCGRGRQDPARGAGRRRADPRVHRRGLGGRAGDDQRSRGRARRHGDGPRGHGRTRWDGDREHRGGAVGPPSPRRGRQLRARPVRGRGPRRRDPEPGHHRPRPGHQPRRAGPRGRAPVARSSPRRTSRA